MYPEYSGATLLGELVGKHPNLEEKMSWDTGSGEMVRAQKSREQKRMEQKFSFILPTISVFQVFNISTDTRP